MQAIVLFARSPEREASAKRMQGAAPLFRAVIATWLHAAETHGARAVIACEPRDREALAAIAPDVAREWIEQKRTTFGERVCSATSEAFARGFTSVVIAAIDAPPPARLGDALRALANGVAVMGPARDGGINFIGVTHVDRELLANLTFTRCRAALPNAVIFEAATDVDSSSALHAAQREKAWRGYFVTTPRFPSRYVADVLRGVFLPRSSRAPPC